MWSEDLRQLTRDIVSEYRFVPRSDEVRFKNHDGRFGLIALSDVLADRLLLVDSEDATEKRYDSVDDLLDDGWVVD